MAVYTLSIDGTGFVLDQGKPTETMTVTETETWRLKSDGTIVCEVAFTTTGFATDTACSGCEWGFHALLTNGAQKSGDCSAVGYPSVSTSLRSPVHYAFERDPLSPPYGGFLWKFTAGGWTIIGTMIVGGDPTTACDLSWSIPAQ